MCRLLVYKGSDEIILSKLILEPSHSILKQSFDSRLRMDLRRGQNNADGFGIGWYTDPKLGPAPGLFTSTTPAWSCKNLERLASKTASRLIFAHVRATTEGSLSEENCHPFRHGSLMWMHNGGLGGWRYIKRRLAERLADRWYHEVKGGTDSEWAFALFLDTLERMHHDPSSSPNGGFGAMVLRKAMLWTIQIINDLIGEIPESTILADHVDTRSILNFVVADGHSVICTRYVSSKSDEAASLYYSSGSKWQTTPTPGNDGQTHQMERSDKGADVVLVASEPLSFERENWVNVPTNSIVSIYKQTVTVHPIIDQYYSRNPHHRRSAAFVSTKGLAANEKPRTQSCTPCSAAAGDQPKKILGPRVPFNLSLDCSHASDAFTPAASFRQTPAISRAPNFLSASLSTTPPPPTSPPSDVRQLTDPPAILRAPSAPVAAQGNIKKKRASLSSADVLVPALFGSDMTNQSHQEQAPLTLPDGPSRSVSENGNGNNNKIAQFFPELALSN